MQRLIIILSLLTFLLVGFIFGSVKGYTTAVKEYAERYTVEEVSYPTGKEVLDELNKYRNSQGLPDFEVSGWLCDNIADRWRNYVLNNSHEGFRDFLEKQHPGENWNVSEILAPGFTAEETVKNWISSPSHEYYITHSSKVCVYSAEGSSVALLSN